jgi:hypothetical protein
LFRGNSVGIRALGPLESRLRRRKSHGTPPSIPCPKCGEPVEYDAGLAGKRGRCPSCHATFEMPESELQLLRTIRDHVRYIRFWVYPIFALMVILMLVQLLGLRLDF